MSIREHLLKFWNFWPPFLFTGIKVLKIAPDFKHIKAKLKLRAWNANFIGTQYGGSIYSLADPFYMIMLMKTLGPGYKIVDKSAMIYYFKPGKTDLFADFNLTDEDIAAIKKKFETSFKIEWAREVEIKDTSDVIVAKVIKVIHIQKKVTSDKQGK